MQSNHGAPFEPSQANRWFVVRASDFTAFLILPANQVIELQCSGPVDLHEMFGSIMPCGASLDPSLSLIDAGVTAAHET